MLNGEGGRATITMAASPHGLETITQPRVVKPFVSRQQPPVELVRGQGDPYPALAHALQPLELLLVPRGLILNLLGRLLLYRRLVLARGGPCTAHLRAVGDGVQRRPVTQRGDKDARGFFGRLKEAVRACG